MMNKKKNVKFIDLFAGLGGIRLGLEKAFNDQSINTDCVLTSEIKPFSIETLKRNFKHHNFRGDLFEIDNESIPDFDFLLGGFPCQPFSAGGRRKGFLDTRGTLFFEIERILANKKPYGFILENVEGLVKHDLEHKDDIIGQTLKTILFKLRELGYQVTWKVLDSVNFGLAQSRKRVFIVGTKDVSIDLNFEKFEFKVLRDIIENGKETMQTEMVDKLLDNFDIEDLYGKSIKDKRGGNNNIHSWDIGLKGEISEEQCLLLNKLFKERRKKHWAEKIGIKWMDGMPLTLQQIGTFHNPDLFGNGSNLKFMLDDLVNKGYLRFEHPKELVWEQSENGEVSKRVYDESKPKGYNIVTGKLSFEINKILNPNDIAPTLVATDVLKLVVPDGNGLRRLTKREGLRLFGYPESYEIPVSDSKAFDLLGNTVAVPVVKAIAERMVDPFKQYQKNEEKVIKRVNVG